MSKINYMIAAWGGHRRVYNKHYSKDKTYYLKTHLEQLSKLDHNLAQITIIVANQNLGRRDESKKFNDYINELKNDYVVIERENYGQSYGSWSRGFQDYKNFDHCIFIEDDYVFVKNNFDAIMVDKFESKNCGYMCSLELEGCFKQHAAISNGISSTPVLNKIWNKYDCLPHEYLYCINNDPKIIEEKIKQIRNRNTRRFLFEMMKKGRTFKQIARECNIKKIQLPPNTLEWTYVNLQEELEKIEINYVPKKVQDILLILK